MGFDGQYIVKQRAQSSLPKTSPRLFWILSFTSIVTLILFLMFRSPTLFPVWKLDMTNKQIEWVKTKRSECIAESAKEAGSSDGFDVLRRRCYRKYAPELKDLQSQKQEIMSANGFRDIFDVIDYKYKN